MLTNQLGPSPREFKCHEVLRNLEAKTQAPHPLASPKEFNAMILASMAGGAAMRERALNFLIGVVPARCCAQYLVLYCDRPLGGYLTCQYKFPNQVLAVIGHLTRHLDFRGSPPPREAFWLT